MAGQSLAMAVKPCIAWQNQFKAIKLKGTRVYFSATNLFILSGFKLWDVEMGGNGLNYPIQSVYSMGVQLNF